MSKRANRPAAASGNATINAPAWQHSRLLPVLDAWQRDFPLLPKPYAHIAERHGYDEDDLLADLTDAQRHQVLSRVGGVFAPHRVGSSTLAAVAVPPDRLKQAAAAINRHAQVNHNYQREHAYNLWFVVAANTPDEVQQVVQTIASELDAPVLNLPLEAEYHVDLGFSLQDGRKHLHKMVAPQPEPLTAPQRQLVHALGQGLALASRPYLQLAATIGWSESTIITQLQDWTQRGVLRRLGLIVRHHELGYTANAMCVWQVPPCRRDLIGHQMAQQQGVHLCYARRPAGAHWPYNLFCMVHGKDRDAVMAQVDALIATHDLADYPHTRLFSTRRFKQTGARYGARNMQEIG